MEVSQEGPGFTAGQSLTRLDLQCSTIRATLNVPCTALRA
jgi:hypothetical protein